MLPEFNTTSPTSFPTAFLSAFVASVYTLCTFILGSVFSIYEVGLDQLGTINLVHSVEVSWYAVLGGTASVLAKILAEMAFTYLKDNLIQWLKNPA